MKLSTTLMPMCTLAALAVSPAAALADYQSEISYNSFYRDFENGTEQSFGMFTYKYYLEQVSSDNKPLAEAAYLQRASSIEAGLSGTVYDYPGGDELSGGAVGFAYTHMKKDSPLILSVLYETGTLDYSSGGFLAYQIDITSLGLSAGWFIDTATSVDVNYVKHEYEYKPAVYSGNNFDATYLYLSAKTVKSLGGDTAVNVEGMFGQVEYANSAASASNTLLGIAADYYLDSRMSIGGLYQSESGDSAEDEGTITTIRGRFFFNTQLSLNVELTSFSAANASGISYDETNLEIFYRF